MRTATFALFAGIIYLSAGLLGLVPEALRPPPADAPAPTRLMALYGSLLGLFAVNAAHSVVHILIGIWGVVAWQADHIGRRVRSPRVYARALAVLYGLLAVLGLIPATNTLFGFVPLHGHDVWLHAGTALIAAYFGWRGQTDAERRGNDKTDRREKTQPVPRERRYGHGDRRIPTSEV